MILSTLSFCFSSIQKSGPRRKKRWFATLSICMSTLHLDLQINSASIDWRIRNVLEEITMVLTIINDQPWPQCLARKCRRQVALFMNQSGTPSLITTFMLLREYPVEGGRNTVTSGLPSGTIRIDHRNHRRLLLSSKSPPKGRRALAACQKSLFSKYWWSPCLVSRWSSRAYKKGWFRLEKR